jgi:hypothetical protein
MMPARLTRTLIAALEKLSASALAGCEKPAAQQVMSAITLGNPRYFRGLAARSIIAPGAGGCSSRR